MKPYQNRRTLKKRIGRTVYMSSLISVMLFSIAVLVSATISLKPVSIFASNFISNTVAREMNSENFLRQHHITSLDQFNPDDAIAQDWKQTMEHITRLETYISAQELQKIQQNKANPAVPSSNTALMSNMDFMRLNIVIKDRTIYSNADKLSQWDDVPTIKWMFHLFSVESSYPLLDQNQVEVGKVTAMVAPQIMFIIFFLLVVLFIILMCAALFISKLISKLMTKPLLKPLDQLVNRMKEIAEESSAMDSQIELFKPLREIEALANATNQIMYKMTGYSEKLEDQKSVLEEQNEELEAQNEELVSSKLKLQEAQQQLILSGNSIRNLLDNAGQGFLTFGESLRVDPEYSKECRHLFEKEIEGVAFSALLAQGDAEQQRFLDNLLHKLFNEKGSQKRSMYFPLLPDEINLNERHVHLDYKMIQSTEGANMESIMVIMTDITEKRELQSQMEAERNILKMVVKVIVNYSDFTDCIRNYKLFSEIELQDLLQRNESVKSKLLMLYRDVHTYKGNFSQFGLTHVVSKLHEAESELTELIKTADILSQDELVNEVAGLQMGKWLEEDMAILLSVLGESFFNQDDLLIVDKSKIMEIERKMLTILSPNECKILIPDLRKLRFKAFRELWKTYPEYIGGLAERMEKFIHPIEIVGGDFLADTEHFYDFSRSLIHVFRNMIDHAIESPEEREQAGKSEVGTIRCEMKLEGDQIIMELSDDGIGIDPDLIRRRAVEKGIFTDDELASLSEQQIIDIIFLDQFSTKAFVNDISGRGIGLSSVKAEVEKLNGRIEVLTEVGKGTTFRFYVPFEELSAVQEIEFPLTLQPCIETTKHYFDKFAHLSLTSEPAFERLLQEKLLLKKVTSFVGFKGAVEGIFVMTVDEALSREMVKGIVLDPLTVDEMDDYVEDTLAETSNIILGNSIKLFQYFADFMIMDPPITIYTEGASIKYTDSEIWTCVMHNPAGTMQISFVIMKRG